MRGGTCSEYIKKKMNCHCYSVKFQTVFLIKALQFDLSIHVHILIVWKFPQPAVLDCVWHTAVLNICAAYASRMRVAV